MSLVHLEIARVRNLNTVSLDPAERINLIHGANASGKTSLLEAIHLLSMARSFRSNSIQSIIQRGQETLTVFGRVKGAAGLTSVGIEKGRQHTRIRINQQTVQKSSALAAVMPVQVINPDIHRLFEQGPRYRRQFLDWGLFHVEPAFLPVWQAYHKILRQRNAGLRSGSPPGEVRYWDSQLVEQGQRLSELRRQYLSDLQPWLQQYAEKLLDISPSVSYQPGWAREYDFVDAIERSFERDRQQGFTHSGPHRADLVIRHEARPVQEHFSRGQQKLLACAMRLAQVAQYRASQAKVPVLLVDDLPAELDPERRARLMTLLVESGAQLFITATEADLISLPGEDDIKMFHVERGTIREVV